MFVGHKEFVPNLLHTEINGILIDYEENFSL